MIIIMLNGLLQRALPGEGGSFSCIEGFSELFDSVVLAWETENALLSQPMLLDELHTLLHQDGHRPRPQPLLIGYRVCQAFPKHCN